MNEICLIWTKKNAVERQDPKYASRLKFKEFQLLKTSSDTDICGMQTNRVVLVCFMYEYIFQSALANETATCEDLFPDKNISIQATRCCNHMK